MIIWFALGIPILVSLFLLAFFRRKTKLWEFGVVWIVSVLLVLFFKVGFSGHLTRDTEYWGGWVVKAQFDEEWDEYVEQTCSYEDCETYTDSDGNSYTECETKYYDCSYVDDHPEQYRVIESNGFVIGISKSDYWWFVDHFGTKQLFVDMHRDYHTYDGDRYEVYWDGDPDRCKDVTTPRAYENKVQAATSVFQFPEVDTLTLRQYGLYEYPDAMNPFTVPTILTRERVKNLDLAEKRFRYLNATLGASEQIRLWVLVFHNQPMDAGVYQEWLWKRGNKNELVLTIGVDDRQNVEWVYPFSWTDESQIMVEAEFYLSHMDTLDLLDLSYWIEPKIKELWVRKPWSDFDYLTVDPPPWAVVTTYVVTLLVNILLSWYVVANQFTDEPGQRPRWRRY